MPKKRFWLAVTFCLIFLIIFGQFAIQKILKRLDRPTNIVRNDPTLQAKPDQVQVQGVWKYRYPQDYTIVMIGDSMTEYLGNSDELRAYLKEDYPDKTFQILNYGYGSTNLLSVPDRLNKKTEFDRDYAPINEIDYDLILIESMGNNPLSQYPLNQGLKIQVQLLDQVIEIIQEKSPRAKIAFVGTIAPNLEQYAFGQVELTPEKREEWARERMAYIENHLNYAKSHNIPVIDIFHKSMDSDGSGKLDYISTHDYIHPSPDGIFFISKEIADSIYQQNLLPR